MTAQDLLYEVRDSVAYITINREKQKNSISGEALDLFQQYLDQAGSDDAVRVVQISGAGDKAFCTGADLGGEVKPGESELPPAYQKFADLLKRINNFPKPVLGKVKGYCLAGGMGLMLACDIVVADKNSRFGTPEVNVGLFPMMIGALIFRNMFPKQAMDMILTGARFGADKALASGLITQVAEPEQFEDTVREKLQTLAGKSPIGVRLGKEAFNNIQNMHMEDALDYLSRKLGEVASTRDAKEGIEAFLEKRTPQFKGL